MMDYFFSWTHRDLTIVTSEYVKKQFAGIFGLGPNARIIIAGQPRNDIFKHNLRKEAVLKKIAVDYNRQIIIYMPTYRGKAMGADAMKKIVSDLYHNKTLDEVLTQKKSIMLQKLFDKYEIDVIGITPCIQKKHNNKEYNSWREAEIKYYLSTHPEIDEFCVIDDESFDLQTLTDYLIKVDDGLTINDCKKAIQLLKRKID